MAIALTRYSVSSSCAKSAASPRNVLREVAWLTHQPELALFGIDGFYWQGHTLIAIQNGTPPFKSDDVGYVRSRRDGTSARSVIASACRRAATIPSIPLPSSADRPRIEVDNIGKYTVIASTKESGHANSIKDFNGRMLRTSRLCVRRQWL
jgi:hypothetical protein